MLCLLGVTQGDISCERRAAPHEMLDPWIRSRGASPEYTSRNIRATRLLESSRRDPKRVNDFAPPFVMNLLRKAVLI